jgi:hypothetical protein
LVYFDRLGPRTVKPLPGKIGRKNEKQNVGVFLPKRHRLFLSMTAAAMLASLVSAPAQAAPERPLSDLTHEIVSFFGFGPDQANNPTDPQPVVERAELTPREIAPTPVTAWDSPPPRLPVVAAISPPSVETPLRRLFCVEYARMRSGLAVFGDAKTWWARAKNLYARASHPVEEAVMVFSGSKRLKRGHVAVVTHIVSPREIIVDQANWQNRGEIDHATPVLDVSKANDWSQVRVWDIPSGTFGGRVYRISGFIAKEIKTASRD